ncbi:protein kinase domain-containing protein [Streptomyces flavofungini]|uniref:protein kinase domain-containing protein n=1 Tax=Streptomyces flavofungini TaxID=68200 RepID=UPI0025AFA851|nr:protein kinase [Streptomyces flavofungini]WJV49535.1 protein kinase [Streptomyces flavofungini]
MAGAGRGVGVEVGGYRIVARLGAGGMGQVQLARSASGRPVAVKTVHPHLAAEPEFRERFRRETAAARAVTGPYTAAVLDADPDAEQPWLATEFCAGPVLTDAVCAHGSLSTADLAALGASLAEALAAVHAAGLVHRDLKPSNVVVTRDGPRVLDFGIAKSAADDSLTATDEAIGSPGFIAPEQLARGTDDARPGPPADVFALGALLALAVTGRAPFGADGAARVLYRTLHEEPDLDGVPDPALRAFLARCLTRDPADRPTVEQVLSWCAARAAGSPWWERGGVAELIERHEDDLARLLEPTTTDAPPTGVSATDAPPTGASTTRALPVDVPPADALPTAVPPLDTPAPTDTPPTAPPADRRPSRRKLLLWGGGALAAAAGVTGAAIALRDGGRGAGEEGAGSRKRSPDATARGRVLWSRDVGELRADGLVRRGDDLYLLASGSLTCLEARSNTERWVYSAERLQNVDRHRDTVYVLRDDLFEPEMHALTAATGRKVWTSPSPRLNPERRAAGLPSFDAGSSALEGNQGTFVLAGDVLCFLTYAPYDTMWARRSSWGRRWRAYGFDARTREALWFHEGTAAGVIGVDGAGGRIAVAVSPNPGMSGTDDYARRDPLVVLRATDGKVERTVRGGARYPRAHPGAKGIACYESRTAIHAVDLTTGRVRWTRRLDSPTAVTPVPTHGMLLAATSDGLSGYAAESGGEPRWTRTDVEELTAADGSLLTADGHAYVVGPQPGTTGEPGWGLHALDVRTGRTAWAARSEGLRTVKAAAAAPDVVHVYADGTVVAIAPPERT